MNARLPREYRIGVLCAVMILVSASVRAEVPISVAVSDSRILITPRYEGELVRVEGTASEDCDVVVKLTSVRKNAHYSRKMKIGPLWLSMGQIYFENVPLMYKIKSTGSLDDLLPAADQVKYMLGRPGLKASIGVSPGVDKGVYLDQMIFVREQARLFSFGEGTVHRQGRSFSTTFYWPPDGPAGRYRVEAFAVRQGRIVGTAEADVEVQFAGFEAWVRDLAMTHAAVYGFLAVAIAIASGLLVSLVFRDSGRRGGAREQGS